MLISMPINLELLSRVWTLQGWTLLGKDFWNISTILAHFKPLSYYELQGGTRYQFVLDHSVVNVLDKMLNIVIQQ